jgi:hypothetical protein
MLGNLILSGKVCTILSTSEIFNYSFIHTRPYLSPSLNDISAYFKWLMCECWRDVICDWAWGFVTGNDGFHTHVTVLTRYTYSTFYSLYPRLDPTPMAMHHKHRSRIFFLVGGGLTLSKKSTLDLILSTTRPLLLLKFVFCVSKKDRSFPNS